MTNQTNTFHDGWPRPWQLPTEEWTNELAVPDDPLRGAPEALRRLAQRL